MADIHARQVGEGIVVEVSGEVDLEQAPTLWREIERALRKSKCVSVRLAGVTYIDSSGIAALVQGLKDARQRDATFTLVDPSERVYAVLRLAQLDQVFPIEEAAEDGAERDAGS